MNASRAVVSTQTLVATPGEHRRPDAVGTEDGVEIGVPEGVEAMLADDGIARSGAHVAVESRPPTNPPCTPRASCSFLRASGTPAPARYRKDRNCGPTSRRCARRRPARRPRARRRSAAAAGRPSPARRKGRDPPGPSSRPARRNRFCTSITIRAVWPGSILFASPRRGGTWEMFEATAKSSVSDDMAFLPWPASANMDAE